MSEDDTKSDGGAKRESRTFDVNGYTITITAPVGVSMKGAVRGEIEIVGFANPQPVYTTVRWDVL
jgi:hypothetical protein